MRPLIGATTYVFRYLLGDPAASPGLSELIRVARRAGLERLQICENARPLELECSEWRALKESAEKIGLQLTLGCMTLDPRVVAQYLERVEAIGGTSLRIVLEREGSTYLDQQQIRSFIDSIAPLLDTKRVRLAIENHFEIPAKLLAESIAPYPPELVGFCIDAANSLRNFEDVDRVFGLLGNRAVAFHLKDFRLAGTNVSFTVSGAPFGEGQINSDRLLEYVFSITHEPEIYLETWVPHTGDREADIRTETTWLELSVGHLQRALLRYES